MIKFIKKTNLSMLTLFSLGLPFLIIIIWGLIAENVFHSNPPQAINYGIIFVCIFLAGTTGLFQVIKKEAPGIMGKPIKGIWAVISGVLIMILIWGIEIFAIYFYIKEFFQ